MYTIGYNPASIVVSSFARFLLNFGGRTNLAKSLILIFGGIFQTHITARELSPDLMGDTATISLAGPAAVCAGQPATFSVDFNGGVAPFLITPVINGISQTPVSSNSEPFTFTLNVPGGANAVTLTDAIANGVPFFSKGVANITGIQSSAVLSGGGDLCLNGPGDSLTVTFTGTGPFTFVYSVNNIAQAPITTSQNVYRIYINPQMYTKYQLVSLTSQGCPGAVSGMAEVFVYVTSNASLASDLTFCNSVNTTLQINLTGTAPFTVTYAVNGITQPPVTVPEGPILVPINITETTVYNLISIESPGCLMAETDVQTVFINHPPTFSNINFNCNQAAGVYVVTFDVTSGTPPYTLISGSGSFFGDQFVSQPIPIANNYNFTFRDANNCGDVLVTGPNTCNCTTDAGTVSANLLNLCAGDAATTTHNLNQVLDANDVLRYILHTQPSIPTGQILAWSATPDFVYNPAYQSGTTYYISSIAGNDTGNGQVDLNDICLSVSQGTPVVWYDRPTAILGTDKDICPDAAFQIPVQFTGAAPYNLSFQIGNQNFTQSNIQPPFNISGQSLTSAPVVLTNISDAHCNNTLNDTANITVHPVPQAGAATLNCSQATGLYTIEFTVETGDLSTVNIFGLTGNYNPQTGLFTSDNIIDTDPYFATITDQWMCGTDTVAGPSSCHCGTMAGVLAGDTLRLCYGTGITLTPVAGSVITSNDTIIYFLVQGSNPANWSILAQNSAPTFSFPTGPVIAGAVYYVVAVAGKKSVSGIDFSDPCLNLSNTIPVIWRNNVTAALSGDATICAGESTPVLVQLAGGSVYSYDIFAGNVLFQSISNSTTALSFYPVSPSETTIYTVQNLVAEGCTGTGVTDAVISVNPVPEIVGLQLICTPDNLSYHIEFGVSNGITPNTTYQVSGITGTFLTDTIFVSDQLSAMTPFTVTVSSPSGCSSTISGSSNCSCATSAGNLLALNPNACEDGTVSAMIDNTTVLDQNDTLIFVLCSDPAALPQSIIATSNTPAFGFLPGLALETTYFIFAVAGNKLPDGTIDFTDPCTSLSGGVAVEFHEPPSVVLASIDTLICKGQTFQIPITLNGTPPFKLTYSLNGNLQPVATTNLPAYIITSTNIQGSQVFELIALQDANCTANITGQVQIDVKDAPELTISGSATICPGDSAAITLVLEHASSADVEILSSSGPAMQFTITPGTTTLSFPHNGSAVYTIGTVNFAGSDCPGIISGVASITVAPIEPKPLVSNYNGFGITCHDATDGSLRLQPSGGSGQYSYLWDTGATANALTGIGPGEYRFTITDSNGCSTQGSITVTNPEKLAFTVSSNSPVCVGEENGSFVLETVSGGVGPYNMEVEQSSGVSITTLPQTIENLPAGTYALQITDANGCTASSAVIVNEPLPLVVSLGPDQTIFLGDSLWLTAEVLSNDVESFRWTPINAISPADSSSGFIKPLKSIHYEVVVTNSEGCTATDDIEITVKRDDGVYIPNAFSPTSGDANAMFSPFAGREISKVNYMRVYDRWGSLLFSNDNFLPNDPTQGWNGYSRNKPAEPGVYFYVMEVVKYGEVTEVIKGDVTVVR